MKAIIVKYRGPTNTRGSRYIASDGDRNRVTVPIDYALNADENARRAAVALCDKMGWTAADELIDGGLGNATVFVFPRTAIKLNAEPQS